MPGERRVQVLVIGGGVAGLFCRAAIARAGFTNALIEHSSLGDGQTIASQGLLHRGYKYITGGIADLGPRWDAMLRGQGEVDLRGVLVQAPSTHYWAAGGLLARTLSHAAAAVLQGNLTKLADADAAGCFPGVSPVPAVWQAEERQVDVQSLLRSLAAAPGGPILLGRPALSANGQGWRADMADGSPIHADSVVLAAGEGNEALLAQVGISGWMQRRPLHMAMVDGAPFRLSGHCIDVKTANASPLVTITSAPSERGWVWYVGGRPAEEGVKRDAVAQSAAVLHTLRSCLPGLDLSAVRVATTRIDRAEGVQPDGKRPAAHVLRQSGSLFAVWPTKLALAPALADDVVSGLRVIIRSGSAGPSRATDEPPPKSIASPPIALVPWECASWSSVP